MAFEKTIQLKIVVTTTLLALLLKIHPQRQQLFRDKGW